MNRIDALGHRPERRAAFSPELLADVEDAQLTAIVQQAARELDAPIAIVTLVLDHVQYFRAHHGLPADLAASRVTSRDASFCQFVVRDGQPFEVEDAPRDPRVPQQLVRQYAIRSYLGMPLTVGNVVVGSLCVIDDEPRSFTQEQRAALGRMAELVDHRFAELESIRSATRSPVAGRAAATTVTELPGMLTPIQGSAGAGLLATTTLASFLRLLQHVNAGGETPAEMMETALENAGAAVEQAEDAFLNIQANAADAEDAAGALRDVFVGTGSVRLIELAASARELARTRVERVGGVGLPLDDYDPILVTPRGLGTALVATCLASLAERLASEGVGEGLRLEVRDHGDQAELAVRASVEEGAVQAVGEDLRRSALGDPTVRVIAGDGAVRLLFAVETPPG